MNPAVQVEPEAVRAEEKQDPPAHIGTEALSDPRSAFGHRRQMPGEDTIGFRAVRAPLQISKQLAVGLALLQQPVDGEIDQPALRTKVVTAASRDAGDRDEGAVLGRRQGEHVTPLP